MSEQEGASGREQPWIDGQDGGAAAGRVLVLTRNPISEAMAAILTAVGREVVVVAEDADGRGAEAVAALAPAAGDAVVLCDHDAPDAPRVLREALASPASYVAMMASRRRAAGLVADLEAEGAPGLEKLHVPAGLDTGGRSPGEIALSVVAEVVAESHGRRGGPMRDRA